jgi:cytochrome oxidase Cu insertion factor (SCO1/SenC/PrrC family)
VRRFHEQEPRSGDISVAQRVSAGFVESPHRQSRGAATLDVDGDQQAGAAAPRLTRNKRFAIPALTRWANKISPLRGSALTLLLLILALAACTHQSDLPRLFPVPDTTLVAETGKPLNLRDLKGNVVVYDFIFTNCAGTCPMMTQQMRKLTKRIDKDAPVRFVSITVDPTRDTPPVLRAYARRFANDPRWTFLTGQRDQIVHLSVDGFKLAAGGTPQTIAEPLLHSSKFAVAGKDGYIREYYGGTDGDAPDHVARTVYELLRE